MVYYVQHIRNLDDEYIVAPPLAAILSYVALVCELFACCISQQVCRVQFQRVHSDLKYFSFHEIALSRHRHISTFTWYKLGFQCFDEALSRHCHLSTTACYILSYWCFDEADLTRHCWMSRPTWYKLYYFKIEDVYCLSSRSLNSLVFTKRKPTLSPTQGRDI